jgi:cytochrome c oxidase cbb3-type subunit III
VNRLGGSKRWAAPQLRAGFGVLALLAGLQVGCDTASSKEATISLLGRPGADDRYTPPQKELSFAVLFQTNCAGCHGANGKLGPAPPLNDKLFLALFPDADLKRVIAEGRRGTLMPAFASANGGSLTDEQVRVLAEGIKPRWAPGGATATREAPSLIAATDGADGGKGSRDDGLKVFARACASCHGANGEGGRYAGKADGSPVGALNSPDFLGLCSDQVLRRYVITGRPDLGMPDYAGQAGRPQGYQPLTSQEVSDVVALLAAWRQGRKAD